jgi:hypothetical protein
MRHDDCDRDTTRGVTTAMDNMQHNDQDRDNNITRRDNSDRDTTHGMAAATT